MMQREVIKSLQMAVQHENAVLNLTMLHEASIMNRKATFATLDQLKQRLLPRTPMARQFQNTPIDFSSNRLLPTTGTSAFDPSSHHTFPREHERCKTWVDQLFPRLEAQ
jgi:hypothetical protein